MVSDPDSLVRNEDILPKLEDKGFDVISFDDPMVFRFEYESRIRPAWEKGQRPLVILCEDYDENVNALPSDVLISAKLLKFGIDQFFPDLDETLLRELPLEMWETVLKYLAGQPRRSTREGDGRFNS